MNKTDYLYFSIFAFLLVIISFIISPLGEFCVFDDWSYSKAVLNFITSGKMLFTGWTSMPLFTQVIWGSMFASSFGFSFTILRISTVILSFFGITGTYFYFRELAKRKQDAFLLTLIIFLSPVFLNHTFSFNTDVPFYSFVIWSIYLFTKFLKDEKPVYWLVSVIILIAATLIRDIALAVAAGFAGALIAKHGLTRKSILSGIITIAIIVSTILIYRYILASTQGLPYLFDDGRDRLLRTFTLPVSGAAAYIGKNIMWIISYSGFYLSPLFILYYKKLSEITDKKRLYIACGIISGLALFSGCMISPKLAHKFGEIMIQLVFGFTIFGNVFKIDPEYAVMQTRGWDLAASAMAAAGSAVIIPFLMALSGKILAIIKSRNISGRSSGLVEFNFLTLVFYLIPIAISGIYYKYFLFAYPFILAILCLSLGKIEFRRHAAYISILLFAWITYFAIATTHDYLAEEKHRWQLLDYLTRDLHVSPDKIDGGGLFNAWHSYDAHYKRSPYKNWWWVNGEDYLVTYNPVNGYEVIAENSYLRYLPPGFTGRFFAMRKKDSVIVKIPRLDD